MIKSSLDDCTIEFFDRLPDDRADPIEYFDVRISRCDLSATAKVYAGYTHSSPTEWLRELARKWKGWPDAERWESLEGELKLSATNDRRGHITIAIELRPAMGRNWEYNWCVQAVILADAGQLDALARQSERFFGKAGVFR